MPKGKSNNCITQELTITLRFIAPGYANRSEVKALSSMLDRVPDFCHVDLSGHVGRRAKTRESE